MSEASKTENDKIQEKVSPAMSQIPFRLVEKQGNKTTRLLANSGRTKSIEGQNRWFRYDFKEPVFIYRAVVNETGYPDYKSFEINAIDIEGTHHTSSTRPKSGKVYLEVNQFCKAIEFRPPKAYFIETLIDSIEIFGFRRTEVGKFIQFARDIDSLKQSALTDMQKREAKYQEIIAKAQKAEADRSDAVKEVANLKSSADRQKAILRRLESERTDLTTKVSVLDDTLSKNTREKDLVLKELESRSTQKEELDSQIVKLTSQLSELKANIDLFPSELDSFVRQGARNNRTFFWLAAAPIAIICGMFVLLISGAVDLTTKITENRDINLVALIVSRTPYVIVSLAIITACYQIARSFISEMIQVNRQRLNLTKVSIIAKDVSTSAEQGLELSDTDRYNLRVRLKMDLLKDHLKGYISTGLEVLLPTRLGGYVPSFNKNEGNRAVEPEADNELEEEEEKGEEARS